MPPLASPSVSFGFGLGSGSTTGGFAAASATATSATMPTGMPASSSSSSAFGASSSSGTLTSGPVGSGHHYNHNSKRQRSESPPLPGSDDGYPVEPFHVQSLQASNDQTATSGWQSFPSSYRALPKRLRAGLDVGATSPSRKRNGSTPPYAPSSSTASSTTADVGRVLASLDKNSLLTVFSRLLTSDPTMAERIQALMPTPSLASVEASLDDAQRSIRSASVSAGEMRAEFAWGRLRMPVADFTNTALGFMPFFVEQKRHRDGNVSSSPSPLSEVPHPTTLFAYLQLVTERAQQILSLTPATPTNLSASLFSPDATHPVVSAHVSGTPKSILKMYQDALPMEKVSAVNPNVIVSQLIPILLLQWADFVDVVSRSVNEEGRMFGAETVRGWLQALESLTRSAENIEQPSDGAPQLDEKDEEKACRAALFAVGQRLHEQIGWLVGRQFEWRASPGMEF